VKNFRVTFRAQKEVVGLGNLVEKVAQPVARGIDSVLKTNIADCSSCKDKRKPFLNNLIPDIFHPFRK
jgi:hypothetical protein